jgi:hypothetical protein
MAAITAGWNDERACFVSVATVPSSPIQAILDGFETRIADLEAAAGAAEIIYACPALAVRGQVVYETAADKTVALANATDGTKAPAIGVIDSKPTTTTCKIKRVGPMTGLAGLPADQSELFLHTVDGGYSDTAPTGTGKIVQSLGRVVGVDTVEWHIDPDDYVTRA